jgi:hypothetical protein
MGDCQDLSIDWGKAWIGVIQTPEGRGLLGSIIADG